MSVNLVVAVTDDHWFETLRKRPELTEVNFWSPGTKNFKALVPGELFLFKLHAPRNVIAGVGVFTHANLLPVSMAWDAFGEANGARSLSQMKEQIAKYRSDGTDLRTDFTIGCRILTQTIFFEERDWIPVSNSLFPSNVPIKTYNTSESDGLRLWTLVGEQIEQATLGSLESRWPRYGEPQIIRPRLGQGAFRVVITDIYNRRCAVTGERTLPALEASHIHPYSDGGKHEPKNGLLLRGDIHRLFDRGYVTITPKLHFEVSPRIKEEFENGRDYYSLHGTQVASPPQVHLRPDPKALAWHNEHRFL
ncbi:MAG: HNH endonuclease [Gammaproteobacteria bacterium]|nr:HNH endonuclease [Gammaproteobacteria bacterium]MYD80760.1 HNH endonuclease [Gammaproteobacteria bacterium]